MHKFLLFCFCLFFLASPLEAQWIKGCRRFNWCCCYSDPTYDNYECLPFGYVDNINYPDTYDLPVNRCFNYCRPRRYNRNDVQYFQNCWRYSYQNACANAYQSS